MSTPNHPLHKSRDFWCFGGLVINKHHRKRIGGKDPAVGEMCILGYLPKKKRIQQMSANMGQKLTPANLDFNIQYR